MHPDLEALIQAYDAASEAGPKEAAQRREEFEQLLQETLSRMPKVTEESLRNVIRLAHKRWLAKQTKPPTMPPTA